MSALSFRCIGCGTSYPDDRDYFGSRSCAAEGVAVNLEVDYAEPLRVDPREWKRRPRGLWRYDSGLPLRSADAVTLGEGATPLVACETVGADMELSRCWRRTRARTRPGRAEGELATDKCIVALITSSGLKDPETMFEVDELPPAEPTLESLSRVLEEEYEFAA